MKKNKLWIFVAVLPSICIFAPGVFGKYLPHVLFDKCVMLLWSGLSQVVRISKWSGDGWRWVVIVGYLGMYAKKHKAS